MIKLVVCCLVMLQVFGDIRLEIATPKQIVKIQEDLTQLYAQELLEARIYANFADALKAALEEQSSSSASTYLMIGGDAEGYVAVSMKESEVFLDAIQLDEKYRGRGLGKKVLAQLESDLQAKGIEVITLYVFAHNVPAFKLYQKMGYSIKNAYETNGKPTGYLMNKKL